MIITLDLNTNDAESLLRHCNVYQPTSDDCREDSRLRDALEALASAIKEAMNTRQSMETLDPNVLEAATALFGDTGLAIDWLAKPMQALSGRRPLDVDAEEVLTMMKRLEHGFNA
ncbi:antitoxin Xre/MbcA/ParS toxin-binding domain-containing protein [Pseudomonas sp. 35 E 8]|uniref:antitoxin Xre/MbcA/ParS toxin-binding domain-containing protein n=1 Tax=Pseudomonas sp. 35 E 8 TaxID=1844103 RepID=UPI000812564B|nr:antitoxin Xre/MbcA/ParS toxin-binding domain-containing protein [Pseudomonas sp. 35 E 8]CRM19353.1 putative toxin-antitoxin system antitoxin component [Pseudomonas sp. 35 E 8]